MKYHNIIILFQNPVQIRKSSPLHFQGLSLQTITQTIQTKPDVNGSSSFLVPYMVPTTTRTMYTNIRKLIDHIPNSQVTKVTNVAKFVTNITVTNRCNQCKLVITILVQHLIITPKKICNVKKLNNAVLWIIAPISFMKAVWQHFLKIHIR